MKGRKYDEGKPLAGMVQRYFANALSAVYDVGTYGAQKYEKDNWLHVKDAEERYHEALYRHLNAFERGSVYDESGNTHLAHAAWNVLAILELEERKRHK